MAKKGKGTPKRSGSVDLLTRQKKAVKPPKKYKVVFHNDDFTPMDFVAIILMLYFHQSSEAAWNITMQIHEKGRGIAGGPYSKEVAETKVDQVLNAAKGSGYPLLATFEPAD